MVSKKAKPNAEKSAGIQQHRWSRGMLLFSLLAVLWAGAVLAADTDTNGDDLYMQGRYQDAVAYYQAALEQSPTSVRLRTNLACALYQLGQYDAALKQLHMALESQPNTREAGRIHYNIGNSYYTSNRHTEAIEAYKTALRLNPTDKLAKFNLEIALKHNQQPPPTNQNPQLPSPSPNSGDKSTQPPTEQPSDTPPHTKQNQRSQMSRDEAERVLDALRQNEKGPTHKGNLRRNYFNTMIKRDW
ncbi:MAG: tetratricopeptide repeat protein [Acidobacteriota bacterium]